MGLIEMETEDHEEGFHIPAMDVDDPSSIPVDFSVSKPDKNERGTTPGRASVQVQIELSGRPMTPATAAQSRTGPEILDINEQWFIDNQRFMKFNKLPKPIWPKTSPTIPSTVFKTKNERVLQTEQVEH